MRGMKEGYQHVVDCQPYLRLLVQYLEHFAPCPHLSPKLKNDKTSFDFGKSADNKGGPFSIEMFSWIAEYWFNKNPSQYRLIDVRCSVCEYLDCLSAVSPLHGGGGVVVACWHARSHLHPCCCCV